MYVMGLLFEIFTSHMWTYNHIFIVIPVPGAKDISALFPLGWAGWIMVTTTVTQVLWKLLRAERWWVRHLVLMGVWFVVGGAAETTFYRIGMFEYVNDASTRINFLLGQWGGLPPTMILLGYGGLPPLVSQFFLWMERRMTKISDRMGVKF